MGDELIPIFELALALRTPVYEILERMSWQEYMLWLDYFNKYPVGWREDERTYKLLRAQGVKQDASALFNSLAQMKAAQSKEERVPRSGSLLHSLMLNAKGGEQLDILKEL